MAVIIRLQNLSWSATAPDVRKFFAGLSIPNGGVHIVGGEDGDCFVAFSTDEDARKAMKLDGNKLSNQKVKLQLSSKAEMEEIIAIARGEKAVPSSASAASVTSHTKDSQKDASRHRSRSRSPRRAHSPQERSRNGRRDGNRDQERGNGSRREPHNPRDTGRSMANRPRGTSAESREAHHRREVAKVDPLPLSGAGQPNERRILQQPAGDAASANMQTKMQVYDMPQQGKDRGLPLDATRKTPLLPGAAQSTVGPSSESRWTEDQQFTQKGLGQQYPSSYNDVPLLSLPSAGNSWDSKAITQATAVERHMHRRGSDSWPSGPLQQSDPRPAAPVDQTFRASNHTGQPGSNSTTGGANRGRPQGAGGRPPALLPTPTEPIRPLLESDTSDGILPAPGLSMEQISRRNLRGAAAPYDHAAVPYDHTAAPYDHAAASFDRMTSFEQGSIPIEGLEPRGFLSAPAASMEPAVRIFNLATLTTKKTLRATFAAHGVHPVDIKLVRRRHEDGVLGYALFSGAAEAALVVNEMTGLSIDGSEPLSFEPCAKAEYDAALEHAPPLTSRAGVPQLCLTLTDLPPSTTVKDIEVLLAQTEYVAPSLYLERDAMGQCTGAAYVEMSNLQDFETVLAMRKRVAIHGQIIRVRPINKEEMKARVVSHRESLLMQHRGGVAGAAFYDGSSEMMQPGLLDVDVLRPGQPMAGGDRRQRFMGRGGESLGLISQVAEAPVPLLMTPPLLPGPEQPGIVLHLTNLPVDCTANLIMEFLHPVPVDPKYVRMLQYPDGTCSGEAFVKLFHPRDVDAVLQRDQTLLFGRQVGVWQSSEKLMADVLMSFEGQFVDCDSSRGLPARRRGEPLLEPPRWHRFDGHGGMPSL